MLAIVSLLTVVSLSLLVTRIATILLVHTGLSRESARFQARSAFTGVGFTTSESEGIVDHPVRRRVVMSLMLLGNAGIVTAVSSLMLTFVDPRGGALSVGTKLSMLGAGIALLWAVSMSQWVDARLSNLIERLLARYTSLDVHDYASLLHLSDEYRVTELYVQEGDWLAHKTMEEARLRDEGINVLAIERAGGGFEGTVTRHTCLLPGDTLIAYSSIEKLEELDRRRSGVAGDVEHERAARAHGSTVAESANEQQKLAGSTRGEDGAR